MLSSRRERKEYLKGLLTEANEFVFDGRTVCSRFLKTAFGCSNDLQSAVKGTDGAAASASIDPLPRFNRTMPVCDIVLEFLKTLTETQGDFMPDRNEVHLSWTQHRSVYAVLREEWPLMYATGLEDNPPSESYFNLVWRHHMPHVKVRKVHRFSKCEVCEEIALSLARCGSNFGAAEELRKLKKSHLSHISMERAHYHSNRQKAQTDPDKFASIIVDGADQSEFGLPHFEFSTKATAGHAMKMNVVGLLEHRGGRTKHLWLLTMTEDFETGSNHVVEAIHRWIEAKREEDEGRLPPTLFIQVDNCSRENKNKYFMAYAEMLVARGIFLEVQVGFLPRGHTHEDIDQAFSCTSRYLKVHQGITPSELVSCLRKAYHPTPTVLEMKSVANVSGLLEQSQALLPATGNITAYRFFVFTRTTQTCEGFYETTVSVKKSVTDNLSLYRPAGPHKGRGFLSTVPDLTKCPSYNTKALPNKNEILKRLNSEENRINSLARMTELRELCDLVYSGSREIGFHWPRNCIETLVPVESHRLTDSPNSTGETDDGSVHTDWDEEQELEYSPSEFVAVRTGDYCGDLDHRVPFWVGLISRVKLEETGKPAQLYLVWYEATKQRTSPYEASFRPCHVLNNKKKRTPMKGRVFVNSVLVTFPTLTREGKLPVIVRKKIQESLAVSMN